MSLSTKMASMARNLAPNTISGPLVPSRSGSTLKTAANVNVVVRVRPPNEKEVTQNHRLAVDVVDENMLVFDPKDVDKPFFYQGVQQPNRGYLKRPNKELQFVFDHVCGQSSTNRDVFDVTTKEMLSALMEGYNCSVFVYGATGAGKTFTMIGSKEYPGITYLTMDHLFHVIASLKNDRNFDIAVSYLEVYNESVYDLLKPSKTALQLREDSKFGVMVVGLTLHNIRTAQELLNMLENGNKNRTQHPTDANAESSRSHAVFQVYVNMQYKTSREQRIVKLSMIDLAGSERAAATGCKGERFKEGANINRSLLSLGNCINKLADGSSYIPYRDSKLTRLLKDSLGGNCKTVMIANVSPSSLCYEDTYNTLKYAARANKIQLSIKKNIVDGNIRVSQYLKMNEELAKKVKELEVKLSEAVAVQVIKNVVEVDTEKVAEWRKQIKEVAHRHNKVESKLLELMSRQRVLALRHRLKGHAFAHVIDLAHRSSTEAMQQMCTENIPRQERASEHYAKQSNDLEKIIMNIWTKWKESKEAMNALLEKCLSEVPQLEDFVNSVQSDCELRKLRAENSLRQKLFIIQNDAITAFSNYSNQMPNMLKNLYLTLKGYDKVTPSLTSEYLDIMKSVKSGKGITWSDQESDADLDLQASQVLNLDFENPHSITEYQSQIKNNSTVQFCNGTMELADKENNDPMSSKKRKVTPFKMENDTIVIDDSIEDSVSRNMSTGKKKRYFMDNIENYEQTIDTENLNSTFVMAGKVEGTQNGKIAKRELFKKALVDNTNIVQRNGINGVGGRLVKPLLSKGALLRKPAITAVVAPQRVGFGSSLTRTGGIVKNTQAVRGRERMQTHPYSRPLQSRVQGVKRI